MKEDRSEDHSHLHLHLHAREKNVRDQLSIQWSVEESVSLASIYRIVDPVGNSPNRLINKFCMIIFARLHFVLHD